MNRTTCRVVLTALFLGALAGCDSTPNNNAAAAGGLTGTLYWVSSANVEVHKLNLATGEDVVLGFAHAADRTTDGKLIIIGKKGIEESDETLITSRVIKASNVDSVDGAEVNQTSPKVSPDGTKIAYMTLADSSYVCGRTDGAVTARFERVGATDAFINPSWTPDGRLVLGGGFKNPGLYVTDAALTTTTRIDPNLDQPRFPSVSPDGKKIAFVLKNLVWAINIDGTGLQQIDMTTDSSDDRLPTWNPSSTQIAYISKGGHIKIQPAEGGATIDLHDLYPALADKVLVFSSGVPMQWTN